MRIALIGAGGMGRIHAEAYANNPDAELVGIADFDSAAAAKLASDTRTLAYASFEDLVAAEEPDAIDICLPTYLHKEYALKAASYGKHVICEKPLAGSLEDAADIIEACDKAGVKLLVGHVLRFFPEYVRARELILSGSIGRVGTVRSERVSASPRGFDGWYRDVAKSGGVLLDLLIHDFDWMRWTFGEVERVYAKSLLASGREATDHAFASLRFESGAIGYANGSWAYPEGFATRLEVAGEEGLLSMNSEDAATNRSLLRAKEADQASVQVPRSPLHRSPYEEELAHFVRCLRDGETPIVTGADAYEAVRIGLACLRSATTGEAVVMRGKGGFL